MAPDGRPGRPLVVELAGPAGAGKTTAVRALHDDLPVSRIGLEATRPRVAAHLLALAPSLVETRLSGGGPWTRTDLRSVGYLAAWRVDRGGPPVVLVDHGPVFRLASLARPGGVLATGPAADRLWDRLAERWHDRLHAVVWLDAPDDVLIPRIEVRAQDHVVRGAAVEQARQFLADYRTGFQRALDAVATPKTRVVQLDTSLLDVGGVVARVRDELLMGALGR